MLKIGEKMRAYHLLHSTEIVSPELKDSPL